MPGQIILGIPGPWKDRSDLLASMVHANPDPKNPRYLGLGQILTDLTTKQTYMLDVTEHDLRMEQAFRVAGQGRFSKEQLARIAAHTFTAYVLSQEQSPAAARAMLDVAAFLLDAGGLGVKVESAGIAHTPDRWRYHRATPGLLSLHDAYTTMVGGKEFNYTCGMHNLGLPDVSLTSDIPIEGAPEFLIGFNQWNLLERPQLADQGRFALSLTDPAFTTTLQEYGYEPDSEYNNPHGRWHLTLAGDEPPEHETYRLGSPPLFMQFEKGDPAMQECMQRAQATLPYCLARFNSRHEFGTFMIKTRIEEGDEHAFLWVRLQGSHGNVLDATVFEVPPEFPSLQRGSAIEVPHDDVLDWAQIRHGALVGGYSLRLQRSRLDEKDRPHYDLYSGIIAYVPLDEIPVK